MLNTVKETYQGRDQSKLDEYGLPTYWTYFICTNPSEGRRKYDMFRVSSLGVMEYNANGCSLGYCRKIIKSHHPSYPKVEPGFGLRRGKINHKVV